MLLYQSCYNFTSMTLLMASSDGPLLHNITQEMLSNKFKCIHKVSEEAQARNNLHHVDNLDLDLSRAYMLCRVDVWILAHFCLQDLNVVESQ